MTSSCKNSRVLHLVVLLKLERELYHLLLQNEEEGQVYRLNKEEKYINPPLKRHR